jgi:hypothetical protein
VNPKTPDFSARSEFLEAQGFLYLAVVLDAGLIARATPFSVDSVGLAVKVDVVDRERSTPQGNVV